MHHVVLKDRNPEQAVTTSTRSALQQEASGTDVQPFSRHKTEAEASTPVVQPRRRAPHRVRMTTFKHLSGARGGENLLCYFGRMG